MSKIKFDDEDLQKHFDECCVQCLKSTLLSIILLQQ